MPEDALVDALAARACAAAGVSLPPPEGHSVTVCLSPQRWFQAECPQGYTIGAWLKQEVASGPFELQVFSGPRCMHGSPGVLGGFACGWC